MPLILNTIDEIARAEQRDVVCVMFFDPRKPREPLDAARHALRNAFIQFLEDHSILWCECIDPGSEHLLPYSYGGSMYLDFPNDLAHPAYRRVADYLAKSKGLHLCVWTLEPEIKNAADRWAPEDGVTH
jgi:hypothetical protein